MVLCQWMVKIKNGSPLLMGKKGYCTFSETILRSTPPKGYRLHDKGIERVVAVEGQSKARSGDEADYKEYRSIKKG